jgi:hypothetical protein
VPSAPRIACIVEGDGDDRALPILLRRIAGVLYPGVYVAVDVPLRKPRSNIVRAGGIESFIEIVARKTAAHDTILVLIDADDDCPAKLGPELLHRARASRPDRAERIAVVLAKSEYEAWFLAAASSLGGRCGLPDDVQPPPDPEGIRGAKGWLRERMQGNRKYSEPVDQPELSRVFDLDMARAGSDSFDKLWREAARLLALLLGEPLSTITQ